MSERLRLDPAPTAAVDASTRPRLGFLGVGWIGRLRLEALLRADLADVVAIADPAASEADAACRLVPDAHLAGSLEALLEHELDGIVIATPSALHASQVRQALEAGAAVFCQKPLARTTAETMQIGAAAERADRLVGVDFSYRHTAAMRAIRDLARHGELGDVFALDLSFHNAYGPDKPWFRDARLSGGGCMIDLGIHLIDLALWMLDFPEVERVQGRLFRDGRPLPVSSSDAAVEDYAIAQLDLAGGSVARIACSWNLPAGRDAVIEARFHGTRAGAALRNVEGSFYDFIAERFDGTRRSVLCAPPDAWGGRALVEWVRRLSVDPGFDAAGFDEIGAVSRVLDRIYGR